MIIKTWRPFAFLLTFVLIFPAYGKAQLRLIEPEKIEFRKQQFDWGLNFSSTKEQESLKTDNSDYSEEMTTGTVNFFANSTLWNLTEWKQEQFSLSVQAGPLWKNGNWNDSTRIEEIDADYRSIGLKGSVLADYSYRFYYDNRNFTLVKLSGWGYYNWSRQSAEGTVTDSNRVTTEYSDVTKGGKWRTGIDARAGWGMGRLVAVNHIMQADYILEKYYPEKSFSQDEIQLVANVIGKVKNNRDLSADHITEKELIPVLDYLNQQMFLLPKEIMPADWELGEFLPRYHGSRVEFGPFFQYYNQEPDFVYGGYLLYENARYINRKWNRNFEAAASYYAYKHNDWMLGEFNIGWSDYIELKSQIDFGIKYVPGLEIADEEVNFYNGMVPYISYFTQFNPKSRMDFKFAWRFASDEKLMIPGPEISVSVYRSKY